MASANGTSTTDMQHLLDPFQYQFMQRAFVTALLVGVLCSAMGTYVVLRKLAFIGDGIAHASFAGIVIAYLRGADYYIGAGIVAILTALGIGWVHRRGRVALDTAIGVLFTGAFALGIFLMSRQRSYSVDLQSFLFGDILSVNHQDVLMIVALALFVGFVTALLWRSLLYTSFDPIVAQASGMNAQRIEYILLVLLALTIIVSLQAVGIVLVAALLVTPAAAAYQLTRRFSQMMGCRRCSARSAVSAACIFPIFCAVPAARPSCCLRRFFFFMASAVRATAFVAGFLEKSARSKRIERFRHRGALILVGHARPAHRRISKLNLFARPQQIGKKRHRQFHAFQAARNWFEREIEIRLLGFAGVRLRDGLRCFHAWRWCRRRERRAFGQNAVYEMPETLRLTPYQACAAERR